MNLQAVIKDANLFYSSAHWNHIDLSPFLSKSYKQFRIETSKFNAVVKQGQERVDDTCLRAQC